jgi:hypothetical protein
VAGDGEQIDAKLIDFDGNLADRQRRFGMEANPMPSRDGADLSSIGWIVPTSQLGCMTLTISRATKKA